MKDKEISEEELLDELDTMYQRVADIEKEEEAEQAPPPLKIKPIEKKRRSYRTIIILASVFFVVLASIFAITIFDPMTLLQRLKTGSTQPPTIVTPRALSKRPAVVPSPAAPKPPSAVTSAEPPKPPAVATSSAAPPSPSVVSSTAVSPKLPSQSPPVQTKQEAVKRTQEEAEKGASKPQEIVKPNKPAPRGKYYAIQVGAFSDMENVREVVEAFKKEGLEAYWITIKSKGSGSLHRVLVGQFTDENEAAQFLKDKKILKNYPDSFVKEVSSSKTNR